MASIKEYSKLKFKSSTEDTKADLGNYINHFLEKHIKNCRFLKVYQEIEHFLFEIVFFLLFIGFLLSFAVLILELLVCIIHLIRRLYNGYW